MIRKKKEDVRLTKIKFNLRNFHCYFKRTSKSPKGINYISLNRKRPRELIVIQIDIRKKSIEKMSLLFQSLNNQSPSLDMLWTGNLVQFC